MWLTLAAIRNRIAILMASLAIILLGATSLGRMPIVRERGSRLWTTRVTDPVKISPL